MMPPYKARTKRTITVQLSGLTYHIANNAFIAADTLPEEAEHAKHLVTDITQEGNIDRVRAMLDLAYARCMDDLKAYIDTPARSDEEIAQDAVTDTAKERTDYDFCLSLPAGVSETSVQLLRELLTEYMTCKVLEDWLGITYKDGAEVWAVKLAQVRSEILTVLAPRSYPLRRRMSPF